MTFRPSRRTILKTTAAIGAGYWLGVEGGSRRAEAANDKLNIAVIGLGGQGGGNLSGCKSQNIVALCDVDDVRAGKAYEGSPGAKKFYDFRKMFDEMEKQIDAVVISTPDHTHYHPAVWAMNRGKHVYLEKPMAHNVSQVRALTKLAKEKKVATQLGVQRHTLASIRKAVDLIQAGAIGKVTEVHSWVGGNRGMPDVPKDSPAVPETLKFDLWRGPAMADLPYNPKTTPYGWRFWWDYGTGETGNWGCHILDIPFWALGLTYPTRVEASGPPADPLRTPKAMATKFEFPAVGDRGQVLLHWYHGKPEMASKILPPKGDFNTIFIGSEGTMISGFSNTLLLPEEKFADYKQPGSKLYKSPGFKQEWFAAAKGGSVPASCDFAYSGPLTETVLLGNVAYRAGGFAWDAENLKAVGNEKAQQLLSEEFRKGWEI